jgi:hypothetical protein
MLWIIDDVCARDPKATDMLLQSAGFRRPGVFTRSHLKMRPNTWASRSRRRMKCCPSCRIKVAVPSGRLMWGCCIEGG